jgi:DNA-binding MarR family transcriptional regulator
MSKKLPFDATIEVRDNCLCLHAQRAARALARRFDEVLRPFGLTNGQFSLLMSLNRPEPPTLAPVARLLAMDRTTLTAALKPLERRGLLTIEPDPKDRRSRRLALTEEGHAALIAALPIWRETHAEIDRELAPMDPEALRQALRRIA